MSKPQAVITVERRPRRTASIIVYPDDRVRVLVPMRMGDGQVTAFLEEKSRWIERRLRINREDRERTPALRFCSGAAVPFLGRELTLVVKPGRRRALLTDQILTVFVTPALAALPEDSRDREAGIRDRLVAFYKAEAREVFHAGVAKRWKDLYEGLGSVRRLRLRKPGRIAVKDMKTRWGSCSSEGNLSFNWRIVLAPEAVLDYLIVHELCHLVHQNHSAAYWSLVGSILPDFHLHRAWLRKNARRLEFGT